MSNEDTQASPPDREPATPSNPEALSAGNYDTNPPTDSFPAYQPPPPAATYPAQPQWAAASATPVVVKLRMRDHLLVAFSVIVVLLLVVSIGYIWMGDSVTVQRTNNETNQPANNGQPAGDQQGAPGSDLRQGAVFLHSNDARSNEVVAYARNANGTLREVGRYATGGKGSGSVEDNADSLVVGSAEGQASPHRVSDKAEFVFVPNAGSNTISVFRIKADGLELVSQIPSGGEKPGSIALTRGLLYVLNSGEFDDRLVAGTSVLENCGHGQIPSITGFRVDGNGNLTQIPASTRLLSGKAPSGCTQISFTPDGKALVANERIAGVIDENGFGKGAITVFGVNPDGTLAPGKVNEPVGLTPYATTYKKDGTLINVEASGGPANPRAAVLRSYKLNSDGTLTELGSAPTGHTDTCWVTLNADETIAFTSGPLDGGVITSFTVGSNGSLKPLHSVATAVDGVDEKNDGTLDGLLDLATSKDGKFLYQLNGFDGSLYAFAVNDNGTLTLIEKHQTFVLKPFTLGGEGGPWGISVI